MFVAGSVALLFSVEGARAAKGTKRGKRRPAKRSAPFPNLDPTATVTGIYQRAMKDVDGRVVTLSLVKEDRPLQFSAALVALWDKVDAKPKVSEDDVGPIDFDPVTNSQGLTVKSFTVATEKRDDTSETLAVTIKTDQPRNSPDENIIRYNFVREDGRWKIDDISSITDGKPWSLAQLLARSVKN